MLGQDAGHDAADVWRGERVARRRCAPTIEPGHVHVDAARQELRWWRRVEVEALGVASGVAGHADHRGEQRREAHAVHVVGRRHDCRAIEVCGVTQLVQLEGDVGPAGTERQVDHVEALFDRPLQPGAELLGLAGEAGVEHLHARDGGGGRQGVDDAGARGAMPERIGLRAGHDVDSVVGINADLDPAVVVDTAF